jgi:hypothetical protein
MMSTRPDYRSELAAYHQAKHQRQEAVSRNRSRLMRGLTALPLPDLPADPPRMYHIMLRDEYQHAVLATSREEALAFYIEDCEALGVEPAKGARAVLKPRREA